MVKFKIILLIALISITVYSRGNEYSGYLADKQTTIEQQQKEIENLKAELASKNSDIQALQKMNTSEAGVDISTIIYIILFSVVTGLVSGAVIKHRTEALCRCRLRRKLILKQATCIK